MSTNHTTPDLTSSLSSLITAFHILHKHTLLDAYGHISLRDPTDPTRFFCSSLPANLISSPSDLDHWNVADGTAVRKPAAGTTSNTRPSQYSEHWIHACILDRYPEVNSVVHSHHPAMVAASLQKGDYRARAVWHMAGFIGSGCPVFDPANYYPSSGSSSTKRNLLISSKPLGSALAKSFCLNPQPFDRLPDEAVVLLRGHGFVTWGGCLEDAVYRAIYSVKNVEVQFQALQLQAGNKPSGLVHLGAEESEDCSSGFNEGRRRAWPSWRAEVMRSPMYVNELSGGGRVNGR
ncbi:MAG: hypothetical protein M1828_007083 [Chrysothrix sp. TS-e1954]|nr:MAG: hypothetical protein M1828_007083 [Chrysothrix sp. TS-e1954]